VATEVGDTTRQIDAAIQVGGTVYALTATNQVLNLDLATGNTTFVTNYDPAAFFITGAVATPEPGYFLLLGAGLAGFLVVRRRRRDPQI
jgi:PEP-CTERM motif